MNRRKFVIGAATGLTATASGALILAKGFAPPVPEKHQPEHLQPGMLNPAEDPWVYHELDPQTTADRAYQLYPEGNCMYALFGSVMIQFAELYGEPYSSFPIAMMKYGASGIGEYGTICGALNGAAALFGLFVREKSHLNALVEDLFTWYEQSTLPVYTPKDPKYTIEQSVSDSVFCHASTANWIRVSGHRIDSKERSDRCSRLTADVARKIVGMLNNYFMSSYETTTAMNQETSTCIQCHSHEGKLGNIRGKMVCTSCHDKSLAHTLFADIHYKIMD
ncbi:MAG: C-GCAxxG-C-C family protein [bacterium]|jgi:hypothetical protein